MFKIESVLIIVGIVKILAQFRVNNKNILYTYVSKSYIANYNTA